MVPPQGFFAIFQPNFFFGAIWHCKAKKKALRAILKTLNYKV